MGQVTIEGSTTPCTELPRGVRRTVAVTDHVRRLVARGFAVVVDGSLDDDQVWHPSGDPVPSDEPDDSPVEPAADRLVFDGPPARNARRDIWAAFLDTEGIAYPDTASRDDLIAGWEAIEQQRHGGS